MIVMITMVINYIDDTYDDRDDVGLVAAPPPPSSMIFPDGMWLRLP
jgi:hypothetical protein